MSFAENLQFIRKKTNMTQEELAEKLEVSRQSVSKWESGGNFPEMEKLLQICETFHCNMDLIMNGNIEESYSEDLAGYDYHMNRRTWGCVIGITVLIFGLVVNQMMEAFGILHRFSSMGFLAVAVVGVMILVVTGMEHSRFCKYVDYVEDFYKEQEKKKFEKCYIYLITSGVGIIFLGLIIVLGFEETVLPAGIAEEFINAVFLFLVDIAVGLFVFAGVQKEKYNIQAFNSQKNFEKSSIFAHKNIKYAMYSGCIMCVATILFLVIGLVWNLWQYAWIVYPVGALFCGILWMLYIGVDMKK